jgi:stage V sporulation protein AD
MRLGNIKNALLISTGALLSTISAQQGESIPGIAHAVAVTTEGVN